MLVSGPEHHSPRILNGATKRDFLFALPIAMDLAEEMRRGFGGKLIVRGMVNGSGSEIVLLDPRSNKLLDKFLCYLPSPSPDGRYIAFVKFSPLHFAGNTEDHYMV